MKALRSSSSKLFSGGKSGNGEGFLSASDVHVLGRTEVSFLRNQKHVNVGLISLQHNKMMMIRPLFSSSTPSHCSLSSEPQEELEGAETRTQEIHQSKTVHVKLQLQKECVFGEKFLIVGDDPMFGLWDPSDAIPLEWSEEHLWAIELDIPIGRTIQFKFILKDNTGNILWQPGPDRILHTWETKNIITVLEDWENAEFQKITEEGPIQTNEMFIAKSEENNDTTLVENIVGNNGKTADLSNLVNSQNDEILVNHERDPVLVPGLTPLSALQTEEAPLYQDDRSITMDSSVGPDDAKNWNASEFNEQQEPDSDLHQEVTKIMSTGEELSNELKQNPDLARMKEQLQSDMQWGRETLQKLLSNLGLFKHRHKKTDSE